MKTLWIILGMACLLVTANIMAGEGDTKAPCCKACKTSSEVEHCGCGHKCGEENMDLEHPEGKMEDEAEEGKELSYYDATDPIEHEVIQDEMIKATEDTPEEEIDDEDSEQMDFYDEEACKEPKDEEPEEEGDEVAQMMPKDMDRALEDMEERPFREEEMDPWEKDKVREMKEEKEMLHKEQHMMDKDLKLNHIE